MELAVSVAGAMKRNCFNVATQIAQLRIIALGLLAVRRRKPVTAPIALGGNKGSLLADQRGAVAFEMLMVYSFLLFSLLLPVADLAVAGFQFISAWEALRSFGQYVQYNPPADPTKPSWSPALPTTVSGYPINNVTVICGDGNAGCNDATLTPKSYSYTTIVPLTPMVLTSVLCVGADTKPCSFTLHYSERFQ
jgi:hypothetical protein